MTHFSKSNEPYPLEWHVVFGHQVGDDHAGGPGQTHVAVDNHEPAPGHCTVDELSGPVKISGRKIFQVRK